MKKLSFNWLKTKQVRDRLLYTFGILLIFQLGTYLTLPGISIGQSKVSSLSGMMNLLSGGGLRNFGFLALGISPYITASILMQLFSKGIVPYYKQLSEQGYAGRVKMNQHLKYFTFIIGLVSAYTLVFTNQFSLMFGIEIVTDKWSKIMLMFILASGSMFSYYLGSLIDEKGIGNGSSLLISIGILVNLPNELKNIWKSGDLYIANMKPYLISVGLVIGAYLIVMILSWIANNKEYKYPLQSQSHDIQVDAHYFPIKLLASSVMPVIFASSFMSLLQTIEAMMNYYWSWTSYDNYKGILVYIILIFIFSYFYNLVQIDGKDIQKNLQENGMYIQNIPIHKTGKYLTKETIKITNKGAPILAIISSIALGVELISPVKFGLSLTGISLLILMGVTQEVVHQIKGLTAKNNYTQIFDLKGGQ